MTEEVSRSTVIIRVLSSDETQERAEMNRGNNIPHGYRDVPRAGVGVRA